jgi:hypothetical protein
MKTILLHPDAATRADLRRHLTRLDHVVVHEDPNLHQVLLAVAKHRPHFIVAAQPEPFLRNQVESVFSEFSLDVPVLWLPESQEPVREEWLSQQISSLLAGTGTRPLRRYTAGSRTILRDQAYEAFEDGRKQNLPELSENPKQGLAREMAAFARQVECAVGRHEAAQRYLRQVLLTDRGLRVEVAYRAVHGSHKVYWLREHIFRWTGVLAHYLPGVEPHYLPPPAPPSPRLDFLSHSGGIPENAYAAAALLLHGFRPSWMPALQSVLSLKFSGQDDAALLAETLHLAGWSALLRDIALAQVRVMACALAPNTPWYADGLPPHALHRATGIYCDFWHLRHLRTNPQYLRPVADGVLQGVKTPGTVPVVLPFRDLILALGQDNKGVA